MNRYILIRRLRGPAFLLLVGIMALLAQANILGWSESWPLFLILAGVLLLAERAALASEGNPVFPNAANPGVPSSVTGTGASPSEANQDSSIVLSESHDLGNGPTGGQS